MKAEKLLEHIYKYLQNAWYESEIENLKLRDQVEELEMQLTPTRNALAKAIKESKKKDEELQQKREEISRLTIEQNGGPVELPEDDLPDFEQ